MVDQNMNQSRQDMDASQSSGSIAAGAMSAGDDPLKTKLSSFLDNEQVARLRSATETGMQRYPYWSIAAAFGVGFLLGGSAVTRKLSWTALRIGGRAFITNAARNAIGI